MQRLRHKIVTFSIDHPWGILIVFVVATIALALPIPRAVIDTDPKHMLPATSPVRQYNDQVERDFGLHPDVIVLGIVNEQGIVNRETLTRILELTDTIQRIEGVIEEDVVSLSTTDDVRSQGGDLIVRPFLDRIPDTDTQLQELRSELLTNPLMVGRIVSKDGTATAIYIPIAPTANGQAIADQIRQLLPREHGRDQYYLAGDPVARDTFGTEMFHQMAVFAPIAGFIIAIALWLMFRSVTLVAASMAVAMISIAWSMGLLVALGFPVHIMSSMSPIFLMAIATDSVHILNEFSFRFGETREKRRAILETMAAVGRPIFVSDATTAIGFAALATAAIVPVKIFGLVVAFGTLVILLLSFTLLPAMLMLLRDSHIPVVRRGSKDAEASEASFLSRLGSFCVHRAKWISVVSALAVLIAVVGLTRIRVNNNMIHWFKEKSDIGTADREMNARLGGTSTGYLIVASPVENSIKDPQMLRRIEGLQRELERDPRVGRTFSVVDYVKRVNYVLHDNDPAFDRVPGSADAVGQFLLLFSMSAKPRDLENVVDYPYQSANILLQLKSWDADVMEDVIARANAYLNDQPLPFAGSIRPAGIAYFNLVWSDEVLKGMLESFLVGLVLVLGFLAVDRRSLFWGILVFLPLLVTIVVLYGVVGLIGKDFDMPVAVLSTLSLGLAVDFAIHFVARFRERYREHGELVGSLIWTVKRPGRGIFLNAMLFALGFAAMVFADLTPYVTVGVFMAAIMLLSATLSVVLLPGLIHLFRKLLLRGGTDA